MHIAFGEVETFAAGQPERPHAFNAFVQQLSKLF